MRAKVNYKTKKIEIEVCEIEMGQLDDFKKEQTIFLNDLIENYKIELDLLTSLHYDNEAKKFELINLRYKLIMDEHYNKFYKDVLIFENGFIRFNTLGIEFLSFANCYNILEDENKGIWQLKNIVKINVLEWFIEDYNKYPENEYFVQYKLPKEYYNKDFTDVFKPYGFELFCDLKELLSVSMTPPVKFTVIYHFMIDETKYIKNAKTKYKEFVKEYCKGQLIDRKGKEYKYNKIENIGKVTNKYKQSKEELMSIFNQFVTLRKLKSKVE